jgi:hypothetical protein
VGDYVKTEPYLTAGDRAYLATVRRNDESELPPHLHSCGSVSFPGEPLDITCRNTHEAAANGWDASESLLPRNDVVMAALQSGAGVSPDDLPTDPLHGCKVLVVCMSRKEYMDPRGFGEDGSWSSFLSTVRPRPGTVLLRWFGFWGHVTLHWHVAWGSCRYLCGGLVQLGGLYECHPRGPREKLEANSLTAYLQGRLDRVHLACVWHIQFC